MQIISTAIPDVLIVQPKVFGDSRGFFMESWSAEKFNAAVGHAVTFVQDNHSRSSQGVLRGLHYQLEQTQGKLVRVVSGKVWDVAVDLRRASPTFAQWCGVELSAENQRMFWVPAGCAHGFVVTGESAVFLYKTTDYYAPAHERTIVWNDPSLAIDWPVATPIVNAKDAAGASFKQSPTFK